MHSVPFPEPCHAAPTPTAALVARAVAGDAEAIDRWYRVEYPEVWRLCLGLLASRAEAEELAQDAMLHLLDRLSAWDPARPYRPWRSALVVNLCRDRLRRAETRRRHEEAAARGRAERALPDPGERLQEEEVRRVLTETLAALTPREREALVLRDLEGLATDEVARVLGVTASTVRTLGTLARRRLRRLLGPRLGIAVGGSEGESDA